MHFIQITDSPQPAYKVDNMFPILQVKGLRLREITFHYKLSEAFKSLLYKEEVQNSTELPDASHRRLLSRRRALYSLITLTPKTKPTQRESLLL